MIYRRDFLAAAALAAILSAVVLPPVHAQAATPSNQARPQVGIIGAGTVGGTLGAMLVQAGYPVMFSSRHPEELREMVQKLGKLASAGTPGEAARWGQIVLVAVPYGALPQLGQDLRAELRGKVVIDATNPFSGRDGAPARRAEQEGVGKVSAELLPGTRLVRAFNTMSTRTIASAAHRPGDPLAIPIAGDDADALAVTSQLIRDIGLEPVVTGGLETARTFQPGAPGWQAIGNAADLRKRLNLPAR
ncbi:MULTISPECIES: NADPH-dependent F420 reductase [unclassified Achromobacter]|uniref:NADPH-dependent F420 reductase n=1 Tax=unclassified Achromobacter TaxID=2626865 RepID=UPI000B51E3C4|nr:MULTISPECIES: NADPH-dependent F420 reductase [unclassified Achromobacter]OWT72985.1 oxidoreductase [Achromobacter sp. HZ34]OWT74204.1 oxidoreductase [Achromobacter sp. HZ28]